MPDIRSDFIHIPMNIRMFTRQMKRILRILRKSVRSGTGKRGKGTGYVPPCPVYAPPGQGDSGKNKKCPGKIYRSKPGLQKYIYTI